MTPKPVFRRRSALRDTEQAVIFYSSQAGLDVANRLIGELEGVYRSIGESPGLGSRRHGDELGIGELRSRRLRRFPYLIFYREHENQIEILRILHVRSNIDQASFAGRKA